MKRMLTTVLTLSLLLGLAACGAPETAPSSSIAEISTVSASEPAPETSAASTSSSADTSVDDDFLGISGYSALRLVNLYSENTKYFTLSNPTVSRSQREDQTTTYTADGVDEYAALSYNIVADVNGNVLYATLYANSATATKADLLYSAKRFFYPAVIMPYDTANADAADAWLDESIDLVATKGTQTVTIGDAMFMLSMLDTGTATTVGLYFERPIEFEE